MVGMGEFRYCKEDAMAWTIHEDIDFRRTLQIKMVSHGKVWILKGAGYDEVIAIKIDSASVTATQIEHSSIAVEVAIVIIVGHLNVLTWSSRAGNDRRVDDGAAYTPDTLNPWRSS